MLVDQRLELLPLAFADVEPRVRRLDPLDQPGYGHSACGVREPFELIQMLFGPLTRLSHARGADQNGPLDR